MSMDVNENDVFVSKINPKMHMTIFSRASLDPSTIDYIRIHDRL